MPDNLDMVLGRRDLRAEIEKHFAKQRSARKSRSRKDLEDDESELSDWVVLGTDPPLP